MKTDGIKNFAKLCLPFAVSAIVLTLIQPPIGMSFFAWVSLVPFLLISVKKQASSAGIFLAAYVVGIIYWIGNIYWIWPITGWGWFALGIYMGLMWPATALALRFCRRKNVPLFLAAGVLFVGAERLQGVCLGGFFWRFLAHSQYANLPLIQIADIFGAAGVSFLAAMVNGLIAELLANYSQAKKIKSSDYLKAGIVFVLLAGTICYGYWQIGQREKHIKQGPTAGIVQTNVPQSVKDSESARVEIFKNLMTDSNQAIKAGPELVVWPETMVQGYLSKDVLKYLDENNLNKYFDQKLKEYTKDKCYLLAGATGGEPTVDPNNKITTLAKVYNSAFLYEPNGRQANEQYNKIHLVPFGEEIPGKKGSLLHKIFLKFSPYDFDYTLDRGSDYTVFKMNGKDGQLYKFGVMICYEDAVPCIGRKFVLDNDGKKRVDWLVNISNDGWFVRFEKGKVEPSTELAQHAATCVFRAIENRIAILRSVNTGISCLIDSNGEIRDEFLAGTLPAKAMSRTGVAGWLTDRIEIDNRITFFSRYGQWLDVVCAGGLCLSLILMAMNRIFRNKIKSGD